MFSYFHKKFTKSNKNIITRDNSCNVTYNELINNNLKKSIIIHDNSSNFITRTPVSSLDLKIPAHFKIYEILTELDTTMRHKSADFYEKQFDLCDNYYERLIVQNNIKLQNIKNFINSCDTE